MSYYMRDTQCYVHHHNLVSGPEVLAHWGRSACARGHASMTAAFRTLWLGSKPRPWN